MKAGKFIVVLLSILLLTAVQVAAEPSAKQCAEISIVNSFLAPEQPHGLTFDGEHLYCAGRESYPSNIYKLDMAGNVLDSFVGTGSVTGLAYKDGNIWAATDNHLTISELSPSGEVLQTFDAPGTDSTGLVFQHNALWNADFNWDEPVAYLHRIMFTGKKMIVNTYESPGGAPEGLAFDGQHLWHVDYSSSKLYKLNPATKIKCEYDVPAIPDGESYVIGVNPIGLTFDGTYLWMSMEDSHMIYQLDIGE
jgi:outer membrane protein assembly factor BamB